MESENKYLLFVNSNPTSAYSSLDEAKKESTQHLNNHTSLRIELRNSPAQIIAWEYDLEFSDWVQK